MTVAFTESPARFDAGGVQLNARREVDAYVLDGAKVFVRDSHVAGRLVVVARTGGSGEDGVSLFIVDSRSAGISQEPITTIASDRQNTVRFADVRIPAANLLGQEGRGWSAFRNIAGKAAVLESAYLVGLSQMALDMTLDYTRERIQFGRPIAAFQAIQHRAADSATDVDSSRLVVHQAAFSLAEDLPDAEEQAHAAKAWVSEASRRVLDACQQMHGGIGFTNDYRLQLYYRRQKAAEQAWGNADYHRDKLATLLGV